jgi:putative redox protein
MSVQTQKVTFTGSQGDELAAKLELPLGPVRAYALFAHCFTCTKDIFAAARIASELASHGIAVLRFDFTGLGASKGDFANTNFSSNVADLVAAADYLRQSFEAPKLMIGHSLGGAAVLAAATHVPEARAVATIGAPADAEHVVHNFSADIDTIKAQGEAEVTLAGRKFKIKQQFLDDLSGQKLVDQVANMRKALIVFHSPRDVTVGIENAAAIFQAAKHPKTFVSLDDADHLLTRRSDSIFVADVLSAWAARYIKAREDVGDDGEAGAEVLVRETGNGKFQQQVLTGAHRLLADEPMDYGGMDSGPSPYDYVSVALGACTSMTLRMYAERKGLDLGQISVEVDHAKIHAKDCIDCGEGREGRIDRFERRITIAGDVDDEVGAKLLEIADKCPVHRTLESGAAVVTKIVE